MNPKNNIILDSAKHLIDELKSTFQHIPVRLFGSTAVALLCPDQIFLWDMLGRNEVTDIDLVTKFHFRSDIYHAMHKLGYKVRNALQERLLFYPDNGTYLIEIFFEPLQFHHTIRLNPYPTIQPYTICLTDLVLSKLQFEELSDDQLIDLSVIFASHQVSSDFREAISGSHIAHIAANDYDFHKTIQGNLDIFYEFASTHCQDIPDTLESINQRVQTLRYFINKQPKTNMWKIRKIINRLIPNLPVGRPVDNPDLDRWKTYERANRLHNSPG